jgi:hypothetical protein
MSKQTINIGASPNDGTGTPLRTSFDYTNQNFTELYTAVGPSGNNIVVPGNATITGDLTVDTSTLKVDSTNNRVGIGTASPAYPLSVAGRISYSSGIGEGADLTVSSSSTTLQFGLGSSWVAQSFYISGTTAMTLNSTGLGIGDAPASGEKLTVLGSIYLKTANKLKLDNASNNFGASIHNIGASAQAALAFTLGATQAMTLDASGNLLVGSTTSFAQPSRFVVEGNSQTTAICGIFNDARTDSASAINIAFYRNGIKVGSVDCTNAATSYVTSSDYRLKEDVQPLSGGLARVSALKPSIYKWKINGSNGEGFIAHELAEVVPAAVTGEKDAVNKDGTVNPQGVDLSKVVPILVAAIQELTARVQTLEAR